MRFERADQNDGRQLTDLRIAYLKEDLGEIKEETLLSIEASLPGYFIRHLNDDLIVYVARNEREIVACAMLLIVEKPMSPSFITGKTGTVLNVYTKPDYRQRGCAKALMKMLLKDAADKNLSFVELKATEDGYPLYKSLGFEDTVSKYHLMKWQLEK